MPDVVLGVGGYAAGPVMLAAGLQGIPLAVLEPNAYPGMANRWVAPYVARAFIAFSETASFFRPGGAVLTGVPVRRELFDLPPKERRTPFSVLIFGGSQGARTLNRGAVEALPKLAQSGEKVSIVHQTGQTEYNQVREAYAKFPIEARVLPYIEKMPEALAAADLVVCRAGASTVAELAAAGKAAILVPFPSAANQHQRRNAEALARVGAARLIPDRELNGETFFAALEQMRKDPETIARMQSRIRKLAHPEAAGRIAQELERMGSKSRGPAL